MPDPWETGWRYWVTPIGKHTALALRIPRTKRTARDAGHISTAGDGCGGGGDVGARGAGGF